MADAAPFLGTGATAVFGTSAFASSLTDIAWNGAYGRAVIETTHLGTTTAKTFKAGLLYDPGTLTLTGYFDADAVSASAPFTGAAETVTITCSSDGTGNTTTWAASCFVTEFNFTLPTEEKQGFTMTLKASGAITITP